MSYCRWSSQGFWSDVYVYADVNGGYTTHIAGYRSKLSNELGPLPELPDSFTNDQFVEWANETSRRGGGERVAIGLPEDGKTYNDLSPGKCADRLMKLREMGYRVPQFAIDGLVAEMNENNNTSKEKKDAT